MSTNPSHILIARNSRSPNNVASLSSPTETHAAAAGVFRSSRSGSPPWLLEECETDDIESELSVDDEESIELDEAFTKRCVFPGSVKIVVENTTFWAHKEILYFASPFFEAALSGDWAETGRPHSMSSVITISQPQSIPGDKAINEAGPTAMTFAPVDPDLDEQDILDLEEDSAGTTSESTGENSDAGPSTSETESESEDSQTTFVDALPTLPTATPSSPESEAEARTKARDQSLAKLQSGSRAYPRRPSLSHGGRSRSNTTTSTSHRKTGSTEKRQSGSTEKRKSTSTEKRKSGSTGKRRQRPTSREEGNDNLLLPPVPVFRKRRPKTNAPDAVIVLKEERASTFHDFLKFVYPHIECIITWNNVEGLMNISHKLCVGSLQRQCLDFLLTHAAGKPIKAMRIAELFEEEDLYRESSRFVLDNPGGWTEQEMSTLSGESLLKLEKRRNWFLERVLKLGLTPIAKDYQCCASCPDPPACARLLDEKWRQAYSAVFRFGPCQPSMVYRYMRSLEGVSPPLSLTQLACQMTAKAFTATLFDRMFSLTDLVHAGPITTRGTPAAPGPAARRHFLYCTLKPEPTTRSKRSRETVLNMSVP